MLKESDNLDILGVTFDSMVTFENHLFLVFTASSKRHVFWRKSCKCSMTASWEILS